MSCFTDKPTSGEVWQIAHPVGRQLSSSGSRQAVALSCFFTLIETNSGGKSVYGRKLGCEWFTMLEQDAQRFA